MSHNESAPTLLSAERAGEIIRGYLAELTQLEKQFAETLKPDRYAEGMAAVEQARATIREAHVDATDKQLTDAERKVAVKNALLALNGLMAYRQ